MKSIFEPHLELAGKVMDLRLQRQNLVIGNLSNINTPGYKPRRLDFEQQLQSAVNRDARGKVTRTAPEHVPASFDPSRFEGDFGKEFRPRVETGEDSVNLDKEMAIMSKNSMYYDALTQIVGDGFKGLNKVIAEGQK